MGRMGLIWLGDMCEMGVRYMGERERECKRQYEFEFSNGEEAEVWNWRISSGVSEFNDRSWMGGKSTAEGGSDS